MLISKPIFNQTKQLPKLVALVALFSVASIVLGSGKAHAATLNVVTGADAIDANGQCQLSEAIQNINDQAITNVDCSAGDGSNDTIILPTGTISLGADLTPITRSFTIQGSGMGVSMIDGTSSNHYDCVLSTGDYAMTLEGMTLQNCGESVTLEGNGTNSSVTLNNVEVDNATGNGIYIRKMSQVTVDNSQIHDSHRTDPSGMLYVMSEGYDSTVSLSNTTVANNSGGVALDARSGSTMTVTASNLTVYSNGGDSGPLHVSFGILASSDDTDGSSSGVTGHLILNLQNSTITGHHASYIAPYDAFYSTSGVFAGATLETPGTDVPTTVVNLQNNLISDNTVNDVGADCGTLDYTLIGGGNGTTTQNSAGGNVSDDSSCNSYFTQTSDQKNVASSDLHLGTLGYHGGLVPTIPLLAGSYAINAGQTVLGLTTDARGIARPQCNTYDSGAYEYNDDCSLIGSRPSSGSNQANNVSAGAVPAAPKTGIALLKSNPVVILLITMLCAGSMVIFARRYKT